MNKLSKNKDGHIRLRQVDLFELVYLGGGTESMGMFKLGDSPYTRWVPEEITLHQGCVFVRFESGKVFVLPVSSVRSMEAVIEPVVDRMAAARAAKAAKAGKKNENR